MIYFQEKYSMCFKTKIIYQFAVKAILTFNLT